MTLDRNTLLEAAKIARESFPKESDYDSRFKIAAHSIAGTLERIAAAQPDTVCVPRELLDRLKIWNRNFPKGRIYNATEFKEEERELDSIVDSLLAAAEGKS